MDFVSELVREHGEENLQKFILFIVEVFNRYVEAVPEFKPYRQKDGALFAVGALCDKLKQSEPYKSELELMLVQYVFPEFSSPIGHLSSKGCVTQSFLFVLFLRCARLLKPEMIWVKFDRFFHSCSMYYIFVLSEFFKLMDEVEDEDLVFTLETIVDKFVEEMAPHALGLCQNLAAAFWKCMNSAEADEEGDDPGALAAVGCLHAVRTILECV